MARFPSGAAGRRITSTLWNQLSPDIYVKEVPGEALSRVTYEADSELQGISLGVGEWSVSCLFYFTGDAAGGADVKTRWAFTGSWNNPIRACRGPELSSESPNTTLLKTNGTASSTGAIYGLANTTVYAVATEQCDNVIVTTAGLLSIEWAQNVSSSTPSIMRAGSSVKVRQIG